MAYPWEIEITDSSGRGLASGVTSPLSPSLTVQRRGAGTLSFGVHAQEPVAGLIAPEAGQLVKLYRVDPDTGATVLKWHGPVWSADESLGGGGIVQVTAADVWARLARRFTSASYSATDQGQIVKGVIDTANTDSETGIDTSSGTIETTVSRDRSWAESRTPLSDALLAFTDLLDPVDIYFDPIEYSAGKIATLNVVERLGSTEPTATFGYGSGTVANLAGCSRSRSLEAVATRVNAFGDGGIVRTVEDATQIAALGLYVRDEAHSGVVIAQTLTDHAQESIDRFKAGQKTLSLTPLSVGNRSAGVPMLWDDFDLGDVVNVEAAEGSISFAEEARVESVTVGVVGGVETVTGLEVEVWG